MFLKWVEMNKTVLKIFLRDVICLKIFLLLPSGSETFFFSNKYINFLFKHNIFPIKYTIIKVIFQKNIKTEFNKNNFYLK